MIIAFLGYVLVFSQISLWAGIVISGLLRVIPKFGKLLIFFVWGGFIFRENILKIIFFLHFILPFFLLGLVFLHIYYLHLYGRTNKIYTHRESLKVDFNYYYLAKDRININFLILFIIFFLIKPFRLGDPLLFEESNNLVRPVHIVPE